MVTFDPPQQVGANLWRFTWTSDQMDPEYRVYLDGQLVSVQTAEQFDVKVEGEVSPVLEVLDSEDDVPNDAFPPYLRLGWLPVSDAVRYLVQQYDGGWVDVATLAAEADRAWYQYDTPGLADVTVHQWRVIPIDEAGNEGSALAFSVLMVRHPDPPDVTFTYDGAMAGTVTIEAA